MENKDHYTFEQLTDFVDGRLNAEKIAEIQCHLSSGCTACNDKVTFLRRIHSSAQVFSWAAPSKKVHQKAVHAFHNTPKATHLHFRQFLPLAYILAAVIFIFVIILQPSAVHAATIENFSGTVEVRASQSGEWHKAKTGQFLRQGMEIRTGEDGEVNLSFEDGSYIDISPETHIRLNHMNHMDGKWNIEIFQLAGNSEYWIQAGSSKYLLKISGETIETEGGHFLVDIGEKGSIIISVEDGEIEIDDDDIKKLVENGQSIIFSPSSTPVILRSTEIPDEDDVAEATATDDFDQEETLEPEEVQEPQESQSPDEIECPNDPDD